MSSWNDLLEETRRLIQERQAISLANGTDNGLMSMGDYSKLQDIDDQANRITVDGSLNSSSSNPVENKEITSRFNKMDSDISSINQTLNTSKPVMELQQTFTKLADAYAYAYDLNVVRNTWIAPEGCNNPLCFPEIGCKTATPNDFTYLQHRYGTWYCWRTAENGPWDSNFNYKGGWKHFERDDNLSENLANLQTKITLSNYEERLSWLKGKFQRLIYFHDRMCYMVAEGGYGRLSADECSMLKKGWDDFYQEYHRIMGEWYSGYTTYIPGQETIHNYEDRVWDGKCK